MSEAKRPSLHDRIALWSEAVLMTWLVPKQGVGPVMKVLFRMPLFLQRIGLGAAIPRNVLILTTTGRRTGHAHRTPVEFSPGPGENVYLVMSGWDGRTDWYRNARANPCVRVWLRGREWDAIAEPAPDAAVAQLLKSIARMEPASDRMWSRWAGFEIDGSDASYLRAAPHFPSFYLRPA